MKNTKNIEDNEEIKENEEIKDIKEIKDIETLNENNSEETDANLEDDIKDENIDSSSDSEDEINESDCENSIEDNTEDITEKESSLEENNQKNTKDKKEKMTKQEIIFEIIDFIKDLAIIILAMMVLRSYVFVIAEVPTGSMISTINIGDRIFGNRLAYKNKEPERGDIILFYAPDETDGTVYIKRLIGLPGEKLTIKNAKVYINDSDEPLNEEYINEEWVQANDGYEFNIPDNSYFFMGDNRNISLDARFWEHTYVTKRDIIGKAECIIAPFKHIKSISDYEY